MKERHIFFERKDDALNYIKKHGYGMYLTGDRRSELADSFEREKAMAIAEGIDVKENEKYCVAWLG